VAFYDRGLRGGVVADVVEDLDEAVDVVVSEDGFDTPRVDVGEWWFVEAARCDSAVSADVGDHQVHELDLRCRQNSVMPRALGRARRSLGCSSRRSPP